MMPILFLCTNHSGDISTPHWTDHLYSLQRMSEFPATNSSYPHLLFPSDHNKSNDWPILHDLPMILVLWVWGSTVTWRLSGDIWRPILAPLPSIDSLGLLLESMHINKSVFNCWQVMADIKEEPNIYTLSSHCHLETMPGGDGDDVPSVRDLKQISSVTEEDPNHPQVYPLEKPFCVIPQLGKLIDHLRTGR